MEKKKNNKIEDNLDHNKDELDKKNSLSFNEKNILLQNVSKIWPLRLLGNKNKTWIVLFASLVVSLLIITIIKLGVFLKNKELKYKRDNIKIRLLLLLISVIPYVRYIVMGNHSYYHSFFTYRAQLPSIIAIIFILIYTIKRDIEKIKEKE